MKNIKNTNEIPGRYIVARKVGKHIEAFCGFENGVAHIGKADDALVFEYGSMAKMVAEMVADQLGNGFHAIDISPESVDHAERFLKELGVR